MDKTVLLVDYSTYLHRSKCKERLAYKEIVLPPQKDRVVIFEVFTKRDMTFTHVTEIFFFLRSLNFEHINLQGVTGEGDGPIGWNCCESDSPGKV